MRRSNFALRLQPSLMEEARKATKFHEIGIAQERHENPPKRRLLDLARSRNAEKKQEPAKFNIQNCGVRFQARAPEFEPSLVPQTCGVQGCGFSLPLLKTKIIRTISNLGWIQLLTFNIPCNFYVVCVKASYLRGTEVPIAALRGSRVWHWNGSGAGCTCSPPIRGVQFHEKKQISAAAAPFVDGGGAQGGGVRRGSAE